jgi:hypothetical protein
VESSLRGEVCSAKMLHCPERYYCFFDLHIQMTNIWISKIQKISKNTDVSKMETY